MLELVQNPEPSSRERPRPLLPSAPRRPGELLERITLPEHVVAELTVAGEERGVPVDVAATFVTESSLVIDSLEEAGVEQAKAVLSEAARDLRVSRRLSAAEADYLRALTTVRWKREGSVLAMPVRLLSRLGEPSERSYPVSLLGPALRWEAAALVEGLTLTEWALSVVLRGR